MKTEKFAAIDGNEAAARVAYALSEIIAIYPISSITKLRPSNPSFAINASIKKAARER